MGPVRVKVAADCSEPLASLHAAHVDIATTDHDNADGCAVRHLQDHFTSTLFKFEYLNLPILSFFFKFYKSESTMVHKYPGNWEGFGPPCLLDLGQEC